MQHLYIRKALIAVYAEMQRLFDRTGMECTIQWCRRGLWPGNERADAQAKAAVRRTTERPPRSYLSSSHGSIKTSVKHQLRQRRRRVYEQEANDGHHLLSRLFFSWGLTSDDNFRPKDDHRMLTRAQLRIVNMLRTGHSTLNFSSHVALHRDYYSAEWRRCNFDITQLQMRACSSDCCSSLNNGLCLACNVLEDEEHFLLICPVYSTLRLHTIGVWERVYHALQEPFTMKSLLFPPKSLQWRHRKMVLQAVARFAIQSGKFKRFC